MQNKIIAICVIVLAFAGSSQVSATLIFTSALSGDQEVPPNTSTASGSALLTLNDARDRLEIELQIAGLDLDGTQTPDPNDNVVGAHIHLGAVGTNGPVVFGFINPDNDLNSDLVINALAGTIFSAWDLNEGNSTTLADQLPNLLSGDLYFNVHTPAIPSGEIRGQITQVPEPDTLFLMVLSLAGIGGWRLWKTNCMKTANSVGNGYSQ